MEAIPAGRFLRRPCARPWNPIGGRAT